MSKGMDFLFRKFPIKQRFTNEKTAFTIVSSWYSLALLSNHPLYESQQLELVNCFIFRTD